jgi:hypothetical protein
VAAKEERAGTALPQACGGRLHGTARLARWQVGAEAECCGCGLGGGSWGQSLHAANAALGGVWQHKSCLSKTNLELSNSTAAPCCSPSHKFVRTASPFELCANKSSNSPKSRSKCEIRIWFRRPSAARLKCQNFKIIVAVR